MSRLRTRRRENPRATVRGKARTVQKRAEAEGGNDSSGVKKPVQDQIESIERDLDACHAELERLRERLADAETYRQARLAVEIQSQYRQAQGTIHELTGQWEAKVLELEQIEENLGSRKREAGSRKQGAGSRERKDGSS